MTKFEKHDIFFVAALTGLLFLFYPDLFLAWSGALPGDHWEQHFPWAYLFFESLRRGEGPFWTPLIHCGFPIAAESQIGLFYLPNLLLYSLFPFRWAYSYQSVFHFMLSGAATYGYVRQVGLRPLSAFVAAVIFLFGTAYGGAYYNITSLKTIAWFPLSLFFLERFLEGKGKKNLVGISMCLSQSLVAGYLQVALLTISIFILYATLRFFFFVPDTLSRSGRVKAFLLFSLSVLGIFLLALPQLWLSFELSLVSNRIGLSKEYAYVGSLSPLGILTLFLPTLQGVLRGNCLYSGMFSIFLVVGSFFFKKKDQTALFWSWVTVGIAVLLLALGEWSPLYRLLIEFTHFYAFRVPAKFLVFFCFSFSVLAGIGWEGLVNQRVDESKTRRASRIFAGSAVFSLACLAGLYFFLTVGRDLALGTGRWLVTHFIHGKMGHPLSLDQYFEKLAGILDLTRDILTWRNPWNAWFLVLLLATFLLILRLRHVRKINLLWMVSALTLMGVDLYVFAQADIRLDFGSYESFLKPSPVVERLREEKKAGRVGRIYGFRPPEGKLPLVPSANILYELEDVGAYSPFVKRRYYETIGRFGNVNDSNQAVTPSLEWVRARLPLLNSIDVSHLLSSQLFDHPDLRLLARDLDTRSLLYENQASHSRTHFVSRIELFGDWESLKRRLLEPEFDPREVLLLESSEWNRIHKSPPSGREKTAASALRKSHTSASEIWEVKTNGPGFFVLMNSYDPGWRVKVNGQRAALLAAYGLFQAVWLDAAGEYELAFQYFPFFRETFR